MDHASGHVIGIVSGRFYLCDGGNCGLVEKGGDLLEFFEGRFLLAGVEVLDLKGIMRSYRFAVA